MQTFLLTHQSIFWFDDETYCMEYRNRRFCILVKNQCHQPEHDSTLFITANIESSKKVKFDIFEEKTREKKSKTINYHSPRVHARYDLYLFIIWGFLIIFFSLLLIQSHLQSTLDIHFWCVHSTEHLLLLWLVDLCHISRLWSVDHQTCVEKGSTFAASSDG